MRRSRLPSCGLFFILVFILLPFSCWGFRYLLPGHIRSIVAKQLLLSFFFLLFPLHLSFSLPFSSFFVFPSSSVAISRCGRKKKYPRRVWSSAAAHFPPDEQIITSPGLIKNRSNDLVWELPRWPDPFFCQVSCLVFFLRTNLSCFFPRTHRRTLKGINWADDEKTTTKKGERRRQRRRRCRKEVDNCADHGRSYELSGSRLLPSSSEPFVDPQIIGNTHSSGYPSSFIRLSLSVWFLFDLKR